MNFYTAILALFVALNGVVGMPSGMTGANNSLSDIKFKALKFDKKDAKDLPFEGTIRSGLHWSDANGENYFLLTDKVTPIPAKSEGEDDTRNIQLWAYHFRNNNGAFELVRKVQDGEPNCWGDNATRFIGKALTLTDLDKNGYAEVTFMYTVGCRTDVSPDALKLILLENGVKYAIRGMTKIEMGDEKYGGETTIGAEFGDAPAAFLQHAKKQWKKFQKWDSAAQE